MVDNKGILQIGTSLEEASLFLLIISVFMFFIWRNLSAIRKVLQDRGEGAAVAASVVLPDGAVQVTVVAPSANDAALSSAAALAGAQGSADVGRALGMVEERRDLLKAYREAHPNNLDNMKDGDWADLAALVAKARVLYPEIDADDFDRASKAVIGFTVAIRDAARAGLSDVPSGDPRVANIEAQYAEYWASLRWLDEAMAAALLHPPG